VGKKSSKIIAIVLSQLLLISNIAFAGIIDFSSESSYLSPTVNISAGNFNQAFDFYFAQQTEILKQKDTTTARRKFKTDLPNYNLSFQTLFPQIFQFHLSNTIKQNIIAKVDESEISEVQVEYVSDDHVYELFKKHGQNRLSNLSSNEAIKQNLFLYKDGKPYWEAVGMFWPTKRAKKPDAKDKAQRKFLIPNIINDAGYPRKDLRDIKTGALWVIFWEHRLTHEFGKRLLERGQKAEFKVVINLKDGTEVEAYITLRSKDSIGKNIEINFKPSREVQDNINVAEIDLPISPVETFQSKVAKIQDKDFRQQMHILDGKIEDGKQQIGQKAGS
jgi:hypothetical protein